MKIVLLSDRIPPESFGGGGNAAWTLAEGFYERGHEVYVIAATVKDSFEELRGGIPTYHLHSKHHPRLNTYFGLYNPRIVRPLRELLKRLQPDVVNVHGCDGDLSFHSMTISHQLGFPTIFTTHSVMPFSYVKLTHFIDRGKCGIESPDQYRLPFLYNLFQMRPRYNPIYNPLFTMSVRYILRHHTQVRISPSDALRQASEANGLPLFRVIYYGLALESVAASIEQVESLRQRFKLEDRLVVYFGGRISRAKGIWELLKAINEVVPDVPNVTIMMLSRVKLKDLGIQVHDFPNLKAEHICEVGWLSGSELVAAFNLADIVTVPSICLDTFPVTNLEAMAAGKPVIATCFGGSPEAVIDGLTGYIINPFDTAMFAQCLRDLLLDANLRHQMGEAGRTRIEQDLSLAKMVDSTLAAYTEAINKKA